MGGYGAVKLALGAPETFGAAASLSGALDIQRVYRERDIGTPAAAVFENAFGNADTLAGSENDLFALAKSCKNAGFSLPPLFIWCCTEDFLFECNRTAQKVFSEEGYPVFYSESRGDPSWRWWDEQIQNVLKWLPVEKPEQLSF